MSRRRFGAKRKEKKKLVILSRTHAPHNPHSPKSASQLSSFSRAYRISFLLIIAPPCRLPPISTRVLPAGLPLHPWCSLWKLCVHGHTFLPLAPKHWRLRLSTQCPRTLCLRVVLSRLVQRPLLLVNTQERISHWVYYARSELIHPLSELCHTFLLSSPPISLHFISTHSANPIRISILLSSFSLYRNNCAPNSIQSC